LNKDGITERLGLPSTLEQALEIFGRIRLDHFAIDPGCLRVL
jgi:hypothetical protein